MRLKLNPPQILALLQCTKLSLSTSSSPLFSSSTVRDLGVILDSTLSLKPQRAAISRTYLFHLRRIRQLCSTIDSASLKKIIHCLILTRLDYPSESDSHSCRYPGLFEFLHFEILCQVMPPVRFAHRRCRSGASARRGIHNIVFTIRSTLNVPFSIAVVWCPPLPLRRHAGSGFTSQTH